MKYFCIIILWISIIFGFLFIPNISYLYRIDRSINIFLWANVIDPKFFVEFEKETGIKVYASYFESNEELLVKMIATNGKGYDLLSPSDYVVDFLRKHNLLKKFNKSKMDFLKNLNPKLLGHYFDKNNEYSIPSEWYVLGIAVNKNFFIGKMLEPSLRLLFDVQIMPKYIGLINDCRELTALAVEYLYGNITYVTDFQVNNIKQLLLDQKNNVEAYTDFRADFLLESGNCSIVLASNAMIWKTIAVNDNIQFLVPKEGMPLGIENYVIPVTSQKEDYVYKFMDFLCRKEVQKYNFEHHSLLPTRKDADYLYTNEILKESVKDMNPDSEGSLRVFRNILNDQQVNNIWLALKK